MYRNCSEHPAIARTLRTGYPTVQQKPLICCVCGEEIPADTVYGECYGKLCCGECANAEWKELNNSERLSALGYNLKYEGE